MLGFAMMGIDKLKAKRDAWRTREAKLFGIALIGGSIGTIAGMYFFRHKTRHAKFTIGLPLIFVLQYYLLSRLTNVLN